MPISLRLDESFSFEGEQLLITKKKKRKNPLNVQRTLHHVYVRAVNTVYRQLYVTGQNI